MLLFASFGVFVNEGVFLSVGVFPSRTCFTFSVFTLMTQVSSVWIHLPVERVAAWASVSQSDQHHFSLQHQYVVDLSNPLVPFPLDFSDDVILTDKFRAFLVLFVCLLVCSDLSQ